MECCFWPDIRDMKQDNTLVKMLPLRPLRLNNFLQKYQKYVWYQDAISLVDHNLAGPFQFGENKKYIKIPQHDRR